MRRLTTVIGGLQVAVAIHTPHSEEGPGVGVTITGVVDGVPVEGDLWDLLLHGGLPIAGSAARTQVPASLIGQVDEWCMQFMF